MLSILKNSRRYVPIRARTFIARTSSTVPASDAGGCPITGNRSKKPQTENAYLKPFDQVPGPKRYPYFGTILDLARNHGGSMWKAHLHYYSEHGPIARQNLGRGEEVVVYDPREYLNVYRHDGAYPEGGAGELWPFHTYLERTGRSINMLSKGEPWKHTRTGMQGDIVSPQAAQSYLPLVTPVARTASEAFPRLAHNLQLFVTRTAFDMFTSAMVGRSTGSLHANPDPKNLHFIENTSKMFCLLAELLFSPYEAKVHKYMDTAKYKEFYGLLDQLVNTTEEMAKVAVSGAQQSHKDIDSSNNIQHKQQQQEAVGAAVLTGLDAAAEVERLWTGEGVAEVKDATAMSDCYVRRTYERGLLGIDQLVGELAFLFLAGVDTTSNYMNWFIYHLAAHPDKQEKLAAELQAVLDGGDFTKDPSKALPYLKACYRETHRLNPLNPTTTSRMHKKDMALNGYHIPAGTRMNFNLMAVQHDPQYCESPEQYIPERWLDEAVAARKGTPQELLDHRLLATPFSFGARMCLGGRLAEAEIMSLVVRLVQDWEFRVAPDCGPVTAVQKLMLTPDPIPSLTVTPRRKK